MIIARSHAQGSDWPQPRSTRAIHPPSNFAGHAHTKRLQRARKRASQPSGRTPAIDVARLIALVPARLPSAAHNIMRQQDTEPESLEISMLRLLLVALQLDFALPAALDEQEANAIQFVVQTTLQFEVRSPPESRRLLPAATRDQHTTAPPHTHLHTLNT
jgi:hypothetical protein